MELSEESLIHRLTSLSEFRYQDPLLDNMQYSKFAAVLVPFVKVDCKWHLMFIRRAHIQGDIHSGQVAFPGGVKDEGDLHPEATALREAEEEIGLYSHDIKVVGQMQDMFSISKYRVTPVLGLAPWPYRFKLQTEEVSRLFTIPIEWLASDDHYTIKKHEIAGFREPIDVIHYQHYEGEKLWGFSAKIVRLLIDKVFKGLENK